MWNSANALGLVAVLLLAARGAAGEETPELRGAALDYVRSCQSCHLPDGRGVSGAVPALAGFVGYFAHLPQGRAFLARVPGVAMAPLDDARLAAVLNWTLLTFSRDQLPTDFVPFSAAEVADHRRRPLTQVIRTRAALIAELERRGILP